MKSKLLVLLFSLLLILGLASCGKNETSALSYNNTVKEVLTDEDIEKVKAFVKNYILDFEGFEVEITGYKILHDMETDLPNAVDVTYKSDDTYEMSGEIYKVDGWIIVELYGGTSPEGYNVTTLSLSSSSYYANVDDEHKLYYGGPFDTYYKKEGSDIFYHTISPSHNIVPGEYKDPTLSY